MFWLIVKGAVLEIQCSFDPASEVSSSSLRLQRESHIVALVAPVTATDLPWRKLGPWDLCTRL